MSDEPAGVYLPTAEDNVYESTQAANAGWYEEGQHAGALAALVVGHIDAVPSLVNMNIARVTLEVFRVVPLVPLRIDTSAVREGKKTRAELSLHEPRSDCQREQIPVRRVGSSERRVVVRQGRPGRCQRNSLG